MRAWCSSSTKPFQGLSTSANLVARSIIIFLFVYKETDMLNKVLVWCEGLAGFIGIVSFCIFLEVIIFLGPNTPVAKELMAILKSLTVYSFSIAVTSHFLSKCFKARPSIQNTNNCDRTTSADQIKIVSTPIGYIRAGEKLLQKMKTEDKPL